MNFSSKILPIQLNELSAVKLHRLLTVTSTKPMQQIIKVSDTKRINATSEYKFSMFSEKVIIFRCFSIILLIIFRFNLYPFSSKKISVNHLRRISIWPLK